MKKQYQRSNELLVRVKLKFFPNFFFFEQFLDYLGDPTYSLFKELIHELNLVLVLVWVWVWVWVLVFFFFFFFFFLLFFLYLCLFFFFLSFFFVSLFGFREGGAWKPEGRRYQQKGSVGNLKRRKDYSFVRFEIRLQKSQQAAPAKWSEQNQLQVRGYGRPYPWFLRTCLGFG